jgi:hypothetical protein
MLVSASMRPGRLLRLRDRSPYRCNEIVERSCACDIGANDECSDYYEHDCAEWSLH